MQIEVLEAHKQQIENSLEAIHDYVDQVADVYKNEGCWPPKSCSDDMLLDNIVGNPIYCYQVTLNQYHYLSRHNEYCFLNFMIIILSTAYSFDLVA